MKKKEKNTPHQKNDETANVKPAFPGYPSYPSKDDIYAHDKEEKTINPEDITKLKTPKAEEDTNNIKNFNDDMLGDNLDVPGAELDDKKEDIGSEDEENNYYSIGGDNHTDLDENNN
jgi:hypothetical protein